MIAAGRGQQRRNHELIQAQGALTRAAAAQKQLFHFPLDFREGSIQRAASGIDDDFALWTQLIEPEAHGLADPSS